MNPNQTAAERLGESSTRGPDYADGYREGFEAGAKEGRASSTPVYLAVYIAAVNDTNGNPRRGWYVSRIDGKPVQGADYTAWIEEGYGNFPWGVFAVRLGLSVAPETPGRPWYEARDAASPYVRMTGRINVTPGEYRDARKLPRFGGAA